MKPRTETIKSVVIFILICALAVFIDVTYRLSKEFDATYSNKPVVLLIPVVCNGRLYNVKCPIPIRVKAGDVVGIIPVMGECDTCNIGRVGKIYLAKDWDTTSYIINGRKIKP